MAPLPPAVRQRFIGYDEAALLQPEGRALLVGRLLEEGDGDELRWLVGAVGQQALVDFVVRHGTRQLSRRSRAFWQRVLAIEPAPASELQRELWPLA